MAEAIGLVASIITVVGLAGQLIQGCQNIKAWVGNFNSAPKDIQNLIRELNSIEESAKITNTLRIKIDRREVDLQLTPALQQCLDAVEELRKYIVNADVVFQETNHSRKPRGWQRLKFMFSKQVIQASVDRLSRAKVQLMGVQSNVSLYDNALLVS
ncbi:hypothetical protein VE02_10119 [Pseudogymnoascus sp. 03VT05]|nr:hypothetical protein VE02_10119 [Pseudogymnoascus sp. 03VT05]